MMKNDTLKESLYVPNVHNQNKKNVRGLLGLKTIRIRSFSFVILMIFAVIFISVILAHASQCIIPPEVGTWINSTSKYSLSGIKMIEFRMDCVDVSQMDCSGGTCTVKFMVEPHYLIRLCGDSESPVELVLAVEPQYFLSPFPILPLSPFLICSDWGEVEGELLTGLGDNGWYEFYYDLGFAKSKVYVRAYKTIYGTLLRLYIGTDFTDPGRIDYVRDEWFYKI